MLLVAVDGDQGYRLIHECLKDKRFDLSFALRQKVLNMLRGAVSKSFGRHVPTSPCASATPRFPLLGIREYSRIVRSLGRHLDDLPLSRSRYTRGKVVSAQDGCGLRIALGIELEALLSDLRALARICCGDLPHQDLVLVDHIVPVSDTASLRLPRPGPGRPHGAARRRVDLRFRPLRASRGVRGGHRVQDAYRQRRRACRVPLSEKETGNSIDRLVRPGPTAALFRAASTRLGAEGLGGFRATVVHRVRRGVEEAAPGGGAQPHCPVRLRALQQGAVEQGGAGPVGAQS
ncbi:MULTISPECIES: TIGR04141 family sporadically distributed protein [Streptomyces]|uniref:TIGR04141 family sporadically distributed protein n=1 Tax=Streptomyces TaxID=1883 RepID=UPI0036AE4F71